MMRKTILGMLLAVSLTACSGAVATLPPATPEPTVTPTPEPVTPLTFGPCLLADCTPTPTQAQPTEPTGPKTFALGYVVTVTADDAPWATILVSDAKVVGSYKGKYSTDKPQVAGNVFIQAKVTYRALTDGVDYNPYDWQVFCAGEAVESFTFVLNGPQPELHSGTLPNGRSASGYVVYEVPPTGEVRMSYGGGGLSDSAPVFEVVIRAG